MKKKLLFCIVFLMAIFVACGKSESEKTGEEKSVLDNFKREENIASENLDKYNSYIDFYNAMSDSDPILSFDDELLRTIYDENGNFRKIEKTTLQAFGVGVKTNFIFFERNLEEVKKYIDTKPEYKFDSDVKKLVDVSFKLKDVIYSMIDYYKNGFYEDDNYAKGKKLGDEYYSLLDEYLKYSEKFFFDMEELENENNRVLMKELEKTGEIGLLSMIKFQTELGNFSDVLYNRDEYKYSAEEIKKLKAINEKITQELANLEAVSDKQLEKEGIDLNNFKTQYIKSAREVVDFSTSIVGRLEKNQPIEERLDGFDRAYSDVIDAYNYMQ